MDVNGMKRKYKMMMGPGVGLSDLIDATLPRMRSLLFRPEEVAVAEIINFTGEGGLIGAAGLFQNPVNS